MQTGAFWAKPPAAVIGFLPPTCQTWWSRCALLARVLLRVLLERVEGVKGKVSSFRAGSGGEVNPVSCSTVFLTCFHFLLPTSTSSPAWAPPGQVSVSAFFHWAVDFLLLTTWSGTFFPGFSMKPAKTKFLSSGTVLWRRFVSKTCYDFHIPFAILFLHCLPCHFIIQETHVSSYSHVPFSINRRTGCFFHRLVCWRHFCLFACSIS